MYEVKPLNKENIGFIFEVMSEANNVSALHTNVISLSEWEMFYAETQNDNDEENFIVFTSDKPCAWLKLNGLQNDDIAWVSMLVVTDDFKHQGIGKFAVDFSVDYLRKRGLKKIGVQTTKDNVVAVALYKNSGFEISDCIKRKTEDGNINMFYVLIKKLM